MRGIRSHRAAGSVLAEALVAMALLAIAGAAVAAAAQAGLRGVRHAALLEGTVALAARELALLQATPPSAGERAETVAVPGLEATVIRSTALGAGMSLVDHAVEVTAVEPSVRVRLATRRLVLE